MTSVIQGLDPRDVLDFLLVWYLVYRLLLIIRGTRTVPMAAGLLMVFIIHQASRGLGLVTLFTLLDTFVSVIVIFALILFQDDIRRTLVRVGRFARFSRAQEAHVIEEIIRGAEALANKRIGALIVFEREARLDDFIQSGTVLDAAVGRELLYAIFIPSFQNPVHDGAVVIRNYRMSKAGTFLPLTRNPQIDKSLGTRHRAAVGITEDTDAIAVVVSEERGTISMCLDGKIHQGLKPSELRKELLSLFAGPSKPWKRKEKTEAKAEKEPEGEPESRPSTPDTEEERTSRPSTWPRPSTAKKETREKPADKEEGDRTPRPTRWSTKERTTTTPTTPTDDTDDQGRLSQLDIDVEAPTKVEREETARTPRPTRWADKDRRDRTTPTSARQTTPKGED